MDSTTPLVPYFASASARSLQPCGYRTHWHRCAQNRSAKSARNAAPGSSESTARMIVADLVDAGISSTKAYLAADRSPTCTDGAPPGTDTERGNPAWSAAQQSTSPSVITMG